MPLAFPSHQGLILPLWRWWPGRIDALALSMGAAMPDIVDGLAVPIRGELGQWAGHSLLGVALACVPLGLVLTALLRRLDPMRIVTRADRATSPPPGLGWKAASVGIGALSHVAFDFVSHGNFLVLWPFVGDRHLFPAWFYVPYRSVKLPIYREPYPLAPHFVVWVFLSIAGIVLFVREVRRARGRDKAAA